GEATLGVVPGERIPVAGGGACERARDAVGVVEAVERGLSAGAEAAVRDGGEGVALGLDGASLAGADVHAAAGGAFAAGGAIAGGDAGDDVLGGDDIGDQTIGAAGAAAGETGAGAGDTEDLEEVAPIETVTH